MILRIGGRGTRRMATRSAGGRTVTILEPAGLSVPGWSCDPENPGQSTLVIDGRVVSAGRLTEVITAIDAVMPADLPHVRAVDREFVAAEMTAFLRVWLATLNCPVTDAVPSGAAGVASWPLCPPGGHRDEEPLVLLWGVPEEEPLAAVHHALRADGARTVVVDQRRTLSTRLDDPPGRGSDSPLLRMPAGTIRLADVSAAYPRPYPSLPVIPDAYPARGVGHRHVARLEHHLWRWLATARATVVNRPQAAASNDAKPLQTRAASACGFRVPESLLTNDPAAALAFAERHGQVIYKGASGTRTSPGLLDPADSNRLSRLGTCPVYFQRYIKGTNVRVHVVGTNVFPVEITSDALDYRTRVQDMRPVSLPAAVAARCITVTQRLGLLLAGLDLIRTPEDEWYFLEANPAPAFTFFPDSDRVAAAIARLLTGQARGEQ